MSTPHTTPSPADGGSSAVDRRIWLIGVDGSDASRHAALWATRHATGRAEALELLEAWHVPASVAGSPAATMVSGHDLGLYEKSACEHVSGLAAELASTTSLPIDTTVACGRAASVVVEASRRSDLLVLGTRGRGGFARLVLGSTSTQCATHAHVPTVVVPATAPIDRADSIVVAVDASPNSLEALRWALRFADPSAHIRCVCVYEMTAIAGGMTVVVPDTSSEAEHHVRHQIDLVLDTHAAEGGRPRELGADFEIEFHEGVVRRDLQREAGRADLLVMGARGHGAVGAALLGSVSTWLLHHVERPMVVVPHHE